MFEGYLSDDDIETLIDNASVFASARSNEFHNVPLEHRNSGAREIKKYKALKDRILGKIDGKINIV